MKVKWIKTAILLSVMMVFGIQASFSQDGEIINLPAPQTTGGKPLMQALKLRQTMRNFSEKPLPLQVLSNLLWAANGINRPEIGKRTAPTAMNSQEIDVYVALQGGLYFYDAKANLLKCVVAKDLRVATGGQPFVAKAPVNLIFVADLTKFTRGDEKSKEFYSATDTGYISQNVYLFCASEGLATVVRGGLDRDALGKAMRLKPEQKIQLAQTVGYPAE